MKTLSRVENLREEMRRRFTKRRTMLQMFKQYGYLTTADLNKHFGTGCSSRLFELRKEGHIIVPTYERPGLYRYTYMGKKADD